MVGAPRGEAAMERVVYIAALHELRPREFEPVEQVALWEAAEQIVAKVAVEHPADATAETIA